MLTVLLGLLLAAGARGSYPSAGVNARFGALTRQLRALPSDTAAGASDFAAALLEVDSVAPLSRYACPDSVAALRAAAELLMQDADRRPAMASWLDNIEQAWGFIKDADEASDFYRTVLMAYVRSVKGYEQANVPQFDPASGVLNAVLGRMARTVTDYEEHAAELRTKEAFSAWIASLRHDLYAAGFKTQRLPAKLPAMPVSANPDSVLVEDTEKILSPLKTSYEACIALPVTDLDPETMHSALDTYARGIPLLGWYCPYDESTLHHMVHMVEQEAELAGAYRLAVDMLASPYASGAPDVPLRTLRQSMLCRIRGGARPLSEAEASDMAKASDLLRTDAAMRDTLAAAIDKITFEQVKKPGPAHQAYKEVADLFRDNRPAQEQTAVRAVLNDMLSVMVTRHAASISTPATFHAWQQSLLRQLRGK